MRASLFYLALLPLTAQVLFADAQTIEKIKVTVELQRGSHLESLFRDIEKQTTLLFAFDPAQVNEYTDIALTKATRTVKETLELALAETPFTYRQAGVSIIISRRKTAEAESEEPTAAPLLERVFFTVSGKVTDIKGAAMPGVNIIVKGTAKGTTSDTDGKFSIDAENSDVLVFSFIGFKTFEAPIGGRTLVDVSLEEDITALNEVVVNAGYWTVKDREQTGNISRITAEDIAKQPVSNPLQALQGRMPGVYIQQMTGVPGGGFNVQIRGQNSLRLTGNDPLYIIDGVPFTSTTLSSTWASGNLMPAPNPLNAINPSDIENIEVLKDADATAIYGSRGANGVILITTKKGKAGKTNVSINAYQGIAKVGHRMNLLNTEQYIQMRKEAYGNDGVLPVGSAANDLLVWDTTRYTDWQNVLIGGTANLSNVQGSVSGGNINNQFVIGGGYYKESTVFPGDFKDQKISTHFNFNHTSDNQKFNALFSVSYIACNSNLPLSDLTRQALTLAPNAPELYDANGNLNWENSTWTNPLQEFLSTYKSNTENLISNTTLSYNVVAGLKFKTSLGYTSTQMREFAMRPIASLNPVSSTKTGSTNFANQSTKTWIIEPQVEYQRSLGHGKLNVLVGTTLQQSLQQGQTVYAQGFTSDALIENIQAAPNLSARAYNDTQYRYSAVFGRINYNWEEKYLINLTARRDGSSRFGSNKRFANFGAIGAAWIFSNENLIKTNLPLLSFGKLRTSYGSTGNDQIGDYQYLDTYSTTPYLYEGGSGLIPTRLVNVDYAWEVNKKLETALELGFLDDRILISAGYYRNRSSNQLVGYSLPPTAGFASVQYNLPATVENTGWELQTSIMPVKTDYLTWNSVINLTVPNNMLVEYPNILGSSYANTYAVGKSLFIKKRYHYTGVDPQTGVYSFEDLDENGSLSTSDRQFLKEVALAFYGGIQNSITYKSFQLDFFIQFVKQTSQNYLYTFGTPGTLRNQPSIVMERWENPGDIRSVQRFTQSGSSPAGMASSNARLGDNAISDGSFARLKNLSFSFHLPARWTGKVKMQKCRIYVQGQNLLTFTDYLGMDPEQSYSQDLPPLRVFTTGIELTF